MLKIKKIFDRTGRIPKVFQTDDGREYCNSKLRAYFDTLGIRHFVTSSSTKCCLNERVNRTLGQRIARYLTHANSKRFVHKLKDFEKQYNSSYHRTIGCRPDEVTEENAPDIWFNIYGKRLENMKKRHPVFNVGDRVLIPVKKGLFAKGYERNFGEKVYIITKIRPTYPHTYEIVNSDGEAVKGGWYKEELVKLPENELD